MAQIQPFKEFLCERLTVAAFEIFGAMEKTLTEYQREISRSKEENDRLRTMLNLVFQPEIKLQRIDPHQPSPSEEVISPEEQHCEQEWSPILGQEDPEPTKSSCLGKEDLEPTRSPSLGQEDPEPTKSSCLGKEDLEPTRSPSLNQEMPEPTQVKEEQEFRTSQEEEQLQGLESDTNDWIFTPLCVISNCDQDPPQPSHLHQTQTVAEYQGEVSHPKKKRSSQRRELNVHIPEIKLHRIDLHQPSLVSEEEIPSERQHCDQEWSLSLGQEDPEPTRSPSLKPEDPEPTRSPSLKPEDPEPTRSPSLGQEEPEPDFSAAQSKNSEDDNEVESGGPLSESQAHFGATLSCHICNQYFTKSFDLIVHMKTHSTRRTFQCNKCSKCTTSKSNLTKHMRVHTGEVTYPCPVCSKCYTSAQSWSNHVTTHTGEKPYKCSECLKCFGTKEILINHSRIHTGEKPYACKECDKRFVREGDLISHAGTHTGEKPYKCPVCSKCFRNKGHLTSHMTQRKDHRSAMIVSNALDVIKNV